tara:strand:- start:381 stop:536 length:156 start_codon:yes stop_codon:yes gene_type:complete
MPSVEIMMAIAINPKVTRRSNIETNRALNPIDASSMPSAVSDVVLLLRRDV